MCLADRGARFGQRTEIALEASGEWIVDDRDDGDLAKRRIDFWPASVTTSSKNVSVRLICIAILPRSAAA